jgi:hypothetical protein
MTWALLFFVIAAVVFGVAAFVGAVGRISLLAAGLCCFAIAFIVGQIH